MDAFDLAQSFVERTQHAASARELAREFEDLVQRLGFRFFACLTHVDPLKPPPWAVLFHNYPASWAEVYMEHGLHEIDPVLLRAESSILPFYWDSPEFRSELTDRQRTILAQGAQFGLTRGYTVPLHLPRTAQGAKASCSVIPDSALVDTRSYLCVQLMATYAYAAALRTLGSKEAPTSHAHLSPRERQCLEFAALGKSDWAIGQILRISEHTVHRHIESAKLRLGVATRVQAIMRAVGGREIGFGDVIKAKPPSGGRSATDW